MVACWKKEFEGYSSVTVKQGDIVEQRCDAVVSPANSYGFMDGGIDYALSEFFGWDLQTRLQELIKDAHDGELLVGRAEVLSTAHERIPHLVSAPTMRIPMALEAHSVNPYLATKAAYLAIRKFNSENGNGTIKSVAFPGMGSGVGRFPYHLAAKQMRQAYDDIVLDKQAFPSDFAEAQERHRALFEERD